MITEDWAGIAAGIGTQIKTMLNESGIDSSRCPQPPQELRIENAVIHLPEVPSALSLFAAVWIFLLRVFTFYVSSYKLSGAPINL